MPILSTKASHKPPIINPGSQYIRSLDGLRAIAILLVMTFHAEITRFGWMGVQLFFVLSGFLITGILLREREKATSLSFKLKRFWVRRVLRIFPVYYLYLLIIGIIYIIWRFPPDYLVKLPNLATYTFNFTRSWSTWTVDPLFIHFWSLSVEEQFYLFFPLLVFLLPLPWLKRMTVFVVLAAPLFRGWYAMHLLHLGKDELVAYDATYWMTFSQLDAFLFGAAIPIFRLQVWIKKPQRLFLGLLLLFILAGLINHLITPYDFYPRSLGYGFGRLINYQHIWSFTCCNLLFASLILILVSKHQDGFCLRIQKLLENNMLVAIGRVSYGMYIFHWAVLAFVFGKIINMESISNRLIFFIPYCAVVYFISLISFRYFENRFIKLKDRYFRT